MKFFSASDFAEQEWQPISSAQAANIANSKLEREAKVVYGKANHNDAIFEWSGFDYKWPETTHRALLVCIEEIEKKPCEHEPEPQILEYKKGYNKIISVGPAHNAKCGKCGVKLKAKWEPVE